MIPRWFLQVNTQPEVGDEAYDQGAALLTRFFHEQVTEYLQPDLSPVGRQIIDCCLAGGTADDYERMLPGA